MGGPYRRQARAFKTARCYFSPGLTSQPARHFGPGLRGINAQRAFLDVLSWTRVASGESFGILSRSRSCGLAFGLRAAPSQGRPRRAFICSLFFIVFFIYLFFFCPAPRWTGEAAAGETRGALGHAAPALVAPRGCWDGGGVAAPSGLGGRRRRGRGCPPPREAP